MKPSKQRHHQKEKGQEPMNGANKRLVLGAVISVVIMGVVALKIAGQQADTTPLESAPTSAVAPTQQLAPSPTNAQALGPALPAPTLTQDPSVMPSSPAAQVDWAIKNHKPAMILYHSTTCIPCKAMEQLVAKVRGDYEPGVVFIDVITNDRTNSALVRQAGIQAIPTTFFVSRSGKSTRVVGAMKEDALRTRLSDLQKEP